MDKVSTRAKQLWTAWGVCLVLTGSTALAQKQTWTKVWGTSNAFSYAKCVAVDTSSNIFVAGTTFGAFDGQVNSGGQDAFLTKFDPYGTRLWTRIWGSASNETVAGVAVDRNGFVYVTGDTPGSFDGESNTREGTTDFFLTKWSNNGQWLWTRIWGSPSNDLSAGVVINTVNWPYVAGSTAGGFSGQTNTKAGGYDFCLTGFSTNGVINPATVAIWGGTNSDTCTDVAIDPSGMTIYLAGITYVGVFEGLTNKFPYNRLILSACDLGGGRYWSALWGATNKHNMTRSVWAGSVVYVAGYTFGNFDGQSNYPNIYGNGDLFISQFSISGTKNWTRIYGSNSWEEAHGVVGDSAGNAYVTGITGGSYLDGQASAGGSDYFLIKYDSSGNRSWTRLWGTYHDDDGGEDVAMDAAGNVFACGASIGAVGGQFNPGQASSHTCPTLTRWRMGANTPPCPTIVKPTGGREFIANETIACIGSALDVDDSTVTNLVWSIGSSGAYGYGPTATVVAAVAPGTQTVTAKAIDSEAGTGTVTIAVTVLTEGGTSLPLAWEQTYWPLGGSGGGTNDFDGDGLDNWSEWMAGSNPTNSSSAFRVVSPATSLDPSQLVLQWEGRTNREYTVLSSTNLTQDGFVPLTNMMGAAPVMIYTTPAAIHPASFFTIQVGR